MGTSKADKEKIKQLLDTSATVQKKLDELQITLDQLVDKPDFNELYAKWKAENQGLPPLPDPTPDPEPTPEPVPTPDPTPTPEPPVGDNVLWDSNRDGHWDNGQQRTVDDKEGDTGPNGKGLYMAASGSPILEILGNGEARLRTKPGFGRFYVAACNYNASLEFEFNIMSGSVDNLSTKCRSRHQMGGACENRFGGLGTHVALDEVGFKAEKCHNIQDQADSKDEKLSKKLELNTWYKSKYEYKDSADGKSIEYTRWLDYNDGAGWVKVLEGAHKHPLDFYMDKPLYEKQSEFWTRLNGSGIVALRNMRLTAI